MIYSVAMAMSMKQEYESASFAKNPPPLGVGRCQMRVVNGVVIKITHVEVDEVLDNLSANAVLMSHASEGIHKAVERYRELLSREGDNSAQLSIVRSHLADLQKTIGAQYYQLFFGLKKLKSS